MNAIANRQFRLAARPVGLPKASDWNLVEDPVRDPGEGEFLVRIEYISLDPAMRGWMNEGRSYIEPVGIGEVMRAGGIGTVLASNHPGFQPGDTVTGSPGVQEYWSIAADVLSSQSVAYMHLGQQRESVAALEQSMTELEALDRSLRKGYLQRTGYLSPETQRLKALVDKREKNTDWLILHELMCLRGALAGDAALDTALYDGLGGLRVSVILPAADLAVEGLLVGFDGQEHVGPLLQAPSKNACVVCRASAWINTPSSSRVLSSSFRAVRSLDSWVS